MVYTRPEVPGNRLSDIQRKTYYRPASLSDIVRHDCTLIRNKHQTRHKQHSHSVIAIHDANCDDAPEISTNPNNFLAEFDKTRELFRRCHSRFLFQFLFTTHSCTHVHRVAPLSPSAKVSATNGRDIITYML